ncbi:MAG: 4Fe-4S dicluster domain-containing protein [Calditrichaeota bacterium]|nr:4Fe-4S dicluster domain-containing protein [Calditrichota bacterium]MBT7617353.1 4Fe-4S dicluster domain-containing protein [Calditrichota bacterium]MBT7790061.1 4Fe-4S dicluster domain-containing protein [Calditrichota bacterium]
MKRRDFIKFFGGALLSGTTSAYAFRFLTTSILSNSSRDNPLPARKWGMVIDLNKCQSDCTECLTACRFENNVGFHDDNRWDVHWIRKVKLENQIGATVKEKDIVLLCNQCEHPPCAQVCPVQATYKREDGIVIVDHHRCVGCRYCMIACPYNARFFNFKDTHEWVNKDRPKRSHGVAESCNLCAHRLDVGKQPACVEACQNSGAGAIYVGNLNDQYSQVSRLIQGNSVKRIREDLGTDPKVYYLGL